MLLMLLMLLLLPSLSITMERTSTNPLLFVNIHILQKTNPTTAVVVLVSSVEETELYKWFHNDSWGFTMAPQGCCFVFDAENKFQY